MHFNREERVRIESGKYAGLYGYVECYTTQHHLSSEKRLQVKVQTGTGWKTLLLNENNVSKVKEV